MTTAVHLRLPLGAQQVEQVAVDGKTATYQVEAGIGRSWFGLQTPPGQGGSISVSYVPAEIHPSAPLMWKEGDRVTLKLADYAASAVLDPRGILGDASAREGIVQGTVTGEPGVRVLFLKSGTERCPFWSPRTVHIEPRLLVAKRIWLPPQVQAKDLGAWALIDLSNTFNTSVTEVLHRVVLDQHYVAPVCSPTRCSLMTGRYWSRFGINAPENRRAMAFDTVTLATAVKSVGYDTALTGKWHLGSKPEWGPNKFGFDHSYGSLAGGVGPFDHRYKTGPYTRTWHRDFDLLEEQGHVTDLIAAEAVRWLEGRSDRPFFLYVPFTAVHVPVAEPQQWLDANAHIADLNDRLYAAVTAHMDDAVGRILAALDLTRMPQKSPIIEGVVQAQKKRPGQDKPEQITGEQSYRQALLVHRECHLPGKDLIDFGGRGFYLECISTYGHGTAGHTAVQAWALAENAHAFGENLDAERAALLRAIQSLYQPAKGFFILSRHSS